MDMTSTDRIDAATLEARFRHAAGFQSMPAGWTRVGAWIRVSSGSQDEANQVPQVIAYCVDRKYWVACWYVVHAKSAYKGEHQKDLDQALTDMRYGETTALVIWHSDRIERRPGKALLDVLVEFGDAGGRVESVQEPTLGQVDFGGQVTTFMAGLVNHEKSKHISEQVRLAHERIRANNGLSGHAPWGYKRAGEKYNKTIVPTDICRKYAPQIFQRCIDGQSLRSICEWLDAEGVPPARGGRWNEGSLHQIIKNMTYAGRRQDEGEIGPNGKPTRKNRRTIMTCEAVVSMDLWERANEALRKRPRRGPGVRGLLPNRPLLANLKCARCDDSPMYRIKSSDGKYYYRCFGRAPRRKGCGNMVSRDRLENMVAVRMLAWNDEPHQTRKWMPGKTWDSEIAEIAQDIRELAQDPLAEGFLDRMAEKQAQLADYTERNKSRERGHWEFTDAVNDDGTLKTVGQYFYDLDAEARREYLKTRDIRAEKTRCCGGVRVVIDGREDAAHKTGCIEAPETP